MNQTDQSRVPPPPVPERPTETPEGKAVRCLNKHGMSFDQRVEVLRNFLFLDGLELFVQHLASDARVAVDALIESREAEIFPLSGKPKVRARGKRKHPQNQNKKSKFSFSS